MKETVRNSNFEKLRILAMFFIVIHHLCIYGQYTTLPISPVRFVAEFFVLGGKVGAYLFVLITGYFSYQQNFKVASIFKIWMATIFWSVTEVVGVIIWNNPVQYSLEKKEILFSLIPIVTGKYWFVTAFVGMYLLSPLLNMMFECMNKDSLKKTIIICILLFFVVPTIFFQQTPFGNTTLMFCTYYLIGGYIGNVMPKRNLD